MRFAASLRKCVKADWQSTTSRKTRSPSTSTPSACPIRTWSDRKSTRLNSSHRTISYAVFCLKKKKRDYVIHHNGFDVSFNNSGRTDTDEVRLVNQPISSAETPFAVNLCCSTVAADPAAAVMR